MSMQLYQRPGKIAFVDDDPDFLEIVGMILPAEWAVELYDEPKLVLERLKGEKDMLFEEVNQHQDMVSKVRDGQSAIELMLQYWHDDTGRRFSTTRALIVDYAMPAMTGTTILSQLDGWPGLRILLTGQADEMLAVSAFNNGLIQQFIPKQTKDLAKRLAEAISAQMSKPNDDLSKLWQTNLSRDQLALLDNPEIGGWLTGLITSKNWVEYVVIGAPFGILGQDANGQAGWLQIEHNESARDLVELLDAVDPKHLNESDVQAIRDGKLAIDLELQTAMRQDAPLRTAPIVNLPGAAKAAAAYFSIDQRSVPGATHCWQQFREELSSRQIVR